jgi:hypothetical protein
MDQAQLSRENYPQLALYTRYIEESQFLKAVELSHELEQLAKDLGTRLTSTPESQTLQTIEQQLDLTDKLLELRLSPEEHEQFKTLNVHEMLAGWRAFLSDQLARSHLPSPSWESLDALVLAWPTLSRFYEAAGARDVVIVKRALAKLAETGEPLAVLITGGFHSPKITQMLKDRNLGVVVVATKVSQETDEGLYRAVLKYKSGHGSLDDVHAAAHGTQSETTQFASQ